jgi:peptidoglycan/xylan/chitin deacetylase (PgdA/CDA1 family)
MRDWLRSAYIAVASKAKKPQHGVFIMNGHYLSRTANDDPLVFLRLLDALRKFSRFIDIKTASKLVLEGDIENVDETLMAFTFDDGFDDNILSLAPALAKHNTNACCFINPGFIDGDNAYRSNFTHNVVKTPGKRPLTWQQVQQLHDDGFVIGNHTQDHVRLSSVTLDEAEKQVVTAKQHIESRLNTQCDFFAWPFGQYDDVNEPVVDMLLRHHRFVFSGCDYTKYTSFSKRVLNRRHFEADWPVHEVKFFLGAKREVEV